MPGILEIRHAAAVVVAALMPALAAAAEGPLPAAGAAVDANGHIDEQQAVEREQSQSLRRARQQHEAARNEAARKLKADEARQAETNRLQSDVLRFERRESTLHHDVRQLQQDIHLVPRDPADHSAIARRGELERSLHDRQLQLHRTTTSRDDAMRRLEPPRFR